VQGKGNSTYSPGSCIAVKVYNAKWDTVPATYSSTHVLVLIKGECILLSAA
jgi:hypothetical protein